MATARPRSGPIVVIAPMPPAYRGGTEEYAYQLVQRYARTESVHVVTTVVRAEGKDPLSIGSAELTSISAREVFERPLVSGSAAWRTLRSAIESARVVQLHMPFPFVERRAMRWARRAGVPTVLTYHMDAEFGSSPWGRLVTSAYRTISGRPALANCDVVVSNSRGYARASPVLSRVLPKVRVIYQGIDPGRLTVPGGSPPLLVPTDPAARRVVFIGRLVGYKGVPYLLDAVADLRRSGENVELFIAGKGPLLAPLTAKAATLGLGSAAHFLGFVPDDALGRLYREAEVVVSPSLSLLESTPITLMEAMACATPVIGTTLPGTEETIPNDGARGLLVPPHDARALAAAIRRLLGTPRPSGPAPVRTWDDTARDYLALFTALGGGAAR